MSELEYSNKLDELERLLNDPDVPMEPSLIWSLLDEISQSAPSPAASSIGAPA